MIERERGKKRGWKEWLMGEGGREGGKEGRKEEKNGMRKFMMEK